MAGMMKLRYQGSYVIFRFYTACRSTSLTYSSGNVGGTESLNFITIAAFSKQDGSNIELI